MLPGTILLNDWLPGNLALPGSWHLRVSALMNSPYSKVKLYDKLTMGAPKMVRR